MNATDFFINMMSQSDKHLRSLTDAGYAGLARKYYNNIPWLKGCVRFWLQRS